MKKKVGIEFIFETILMNALAKGFVIRIEPPILKIEVCVITVSKNDRHWQMTFSELYTLGWALNEALECWQGRWGHYEYDEVAVNLQTEKTNQRT